MSAPASYGMPPPGIIPALSIRCPWPVALSRLGKKLENRLTWTSCKYRGPLILHASAWPPGNAERFDKKPSRAMLECYETVHAMCDMAEASGHAPDGPLTMRQVLELRSGAFAFTSLDDVIRGPLDLEMKIKAGLIPAAQRAWYMGGFALVLGDVKHFPLVPCSGALGLFGLHKDAYAAVMKLRAA